MPRPLSRRRALAWGTAGLAAPALASCSGGDGPAAEQDVTPAPTPTPDGVPTGSAPPEGQTTTPSTTPTAAPADVVATADVPVGGGVIPEGAGIVVTQPTRGTFRGFDPACTHAGCLVSEVTTTIDCLCHGSAFDLATGAPVAGPAPTPLAPIGVRVVDGQVRRA